MALPLDRPYASAASDALWIARINAGGLCPIGLFLQPFDRWPEKSANVESRTGKFWPTGHERAAKTFCSVVE